MHLATDPTTKSTGFEGSLECFAPDPLEVDDVSQENTPLVLPAGDSPDASLVARSAQAETTCA